MSSNAPHSSMRRYVIAAVAAIGCLLPAACDVAAASPGEHHNNTGQNQQGGQQGGNRHDGGSRPTASGNGGSSSASAQPTSDEGADPTGVDDPATNPTDDPANPAAGDTVDPTASAAPTTVAATGDIKNNNGLDVLARDCSNSKLAPADGFQKAPVCVSTAFGEVADQDKDPSLLITGFPLRVRPNTPFALKVSTKNLVRDRFLGAAVGGYYLESSVLNADGLQRGHFHTACRMLSSLNTPPDPAAVPAFFLATQDNGGGAKADTVSVNVTGLPGRGIAQCTVWAGDGSHRIPMMERANQTPAIDSVRILVI
jgi:hypothetical protein